MDLLAIAGQALGVLSPFLAKGGEALAGEAAKDLWALVKKPFHSERDKQLIEGLEQRPDDARQQGMVQVKLAEKLEEDPELLGQLVELLKGMKSGVINQYHSGAGDNVGGDKIIYH